MTTSAGDLQGKVALVTGAARGQGRAHATTLARHGADVIAVDIAAQIDTVLYPLGTEEELAETAKAVEELDRRVLTVQADVRSQTQLDDAVRRGLAEFGRSTYWWPTPASMASPRSGRSRMRSGTT